MVAPLPVMSTASSPTIREARAADRDVLVGVINRAFDVERFFKKDDRTDAAEVSRLLDAGTFLMAIDDAGVCLGCAYTAERGQVATLGLLSVAPALQGRGVGRALVDAVEARAAGLGYGEIEIWVANLRTELFPFYHRRGYREHGTAPFDHPALTVPCHFVVMRKPLGRTETPDVI
jgi:GNAT superfamily N-acetyltransferase